MSPPRKAKKAKEQEPEGITKITVKGFKSLAEETSIDIRPLTILAGANSSGKSSIMQPLLLLKQTLEASYAPRGLNLSGAHLVLDRYDQFLARLPGDRVASQLRVRVSDQFEQWTENTYEWTGDDLHLAETHRRLGDLDIRLRRDMKPAEVWRQMQGFLGEWGDGRGLEDVAWGVTEEHGLLQPDYRAADRRSGRIVAGLGLPAGPLEQAVRALHVPGRRGIPGRMYPRTGTGPLFPGPFDPYTGSIILDWQEAGDPRRRQVGDALAEMELADDVTARAFGDVGVEVFVPIRPVGSDETWTDTANIVDVGTSVQHVLPVLVALHAAEPGRLVYIEQPEIHLHPRAQVALAGLLADAANRGVRVVAETHSSLLLLAIQTLVADRKIERDSVILHWFRRRDEDGVTEVYPGQIDETGAVPDWPEDFSAVELRADNAFLDAHEARLGMK